MTYLRNNANSRCIPYVLFAYVLTVCSLSLFPNKVLAWTQHGHETIARWVYSDLDKSQQKYYARLARSLSLSASDDDAEQFAALSTFPDQYRKDKLEKVFQRFNVRLPETLSDLANKNTSAWHYHNATINEYNPAGNVNRATPKCTFKNNGQLLGMMRRLDGALKKTLSRKQKAILLGFQMHLLQDLHQPLHNFTRLNKRCRSDLGGNRTCVKKKGSECKMNLHTLWDIGFGIFNADPADFDITENYVFSPEAWSKENLQYYATVYDFQGQGYTKQANAIVQQQVNKARWRLLNYLISGSLTHHYE